MKSKVPNDYISLFNPVFNLKKILEKEQDILDINKDQQIIINLMVTHYVTFLINCIASYNKNINTEQSFNVRRIIENILEGGGYELIDSERRCLISFCDQAAKYVNTTNQLYLHAANFDCYLNYQIYASLHSHKGLFDFLGYCTLEQATIDKIKSYGLAAKAVINATVVNVNIKKNKNIFKRF